MAKERFFRNNRMSIPMEDMLDKVNTFEEFEEKFPEEFLDEDTQTGEYLGELLYKYDKDCATVSEAAYLERSYVGKIVRCQKKNPSRDSLIAICLAIGTTVDEVQHLLRYAGYNPLYVRRKRDVIIWFGFMKGYSITEVDIELEKYGFKIFNKEK